MTQKQFYTICIYKNKRKVMVHRAECHQIRSYHRDSVTTEWKYALEQYEVEYWFRVYNNHQRHFCKHCLAALSYGKQ